MQPNSTACSDATGQLVLYCIAPGVASCGSAGILAFNIGMTCLEQPLSPQQRPKGSESDTLPALDHPTIPLYFCCCAGVGGDAFALFYDAKQKKVHCMQGNGAAPAGLSMEAVRAAGITGPELPHRHAMTVAVPGAVALWEDSVKRWGSGKKTLADILDPAIQLAEQGFPVGPVAAFEWGEGADIIKTAGGPGSRALITDEGLGPKPGQLWVNKDLAATYRRIAELGAYEGKPA